MAAAQNEPKTIASHEAFRKLFPKLLAMQEEHPKLAVAALANPILALEELGYSFSPEIRAHMERLARFGEEKTTEIEEIEGRLTKSFGKTVSIEDGPALATSLVAKLPQKLLDETAEEPEPAAAPKLSTKRVAREADSAIAAQTVALASTVKLSDLITKQLAAPVQRNFLSLTQPPDALAKFKGREPLLDDVIRLREIEGSRARLAEPETFQKILSGEVKTPLSNVRFRPTKARTEEKD